MLSRYNLELAKLASKERSRFNPSGVYVTPKETVVTDGHILVSVGTPEFKADSYPTLPGCAPAVDDFAPFVLPSSDAATIAKNLPKKSTIPILNCAAVLAPNVITGEDGTKTTFQTIATTDLSSASPVTVRLDPTKHFPDYAQVIDHAPSADNEEFSIAVNPALLAAVCDFAAKSSGAKRDQVRSCVLRFRSNSEAIRIDAKTDSGEPIVALVMPVTSGEEKTDSAAGTIKAIKRTGASQWDNGRKLLARLREQVAELEALLP